MQHQQQQQQLSYHHPHRLSNKRQFLWCNRVAIPLQARVPWRWSEHWSLITFIHQVEQHLILENEDEMNVYKSESNESRKGVNRRSWKIQSLRQSAYMWIWNSMVLLSWSLREWQIMEVPIPVMVATNWIIFLDAWARVLEVRYETIHSLIDWNEWGVSWQARPVGQFNLHCDEDSPYMMANEKKAMKLHMLRLFLCTSLFGTRKNTTYSEKQSSFFRGVYLYLSTLEEAE